MKVSKSDKAIKPILTACYPEWKGRKVSLAVCSSYQMSDYWSEGSRNFVKAYYLPNGSTAETSPWANVPWDKRSTARVAIPAGVALVEHSIFCGKDAGVTIYVGADDLTRLLPGAATTACPNPEQATMLRKLNRLNRAELTALGDREMRACPNPVHLATALAKLNRP